MGNGSQQVDSQSAARLWQGDTALRSIADRLTRSATIALLLSPVGLLLISATRLLIISDYNPVTASAIVSSSGYVNTLLGTVIPLIPIFMPYLALVLLFFNRVIIGILALLATAFISPTTMSRSAAASLAARDWHRIAHAHVIIIIVMMAFASFVAFLLFIELFGISFSSFMRTIATMVCIALIPTVVLLYPLPVNNKFYAQLVRRKCSVNPWDLDLHPAAELRKRPRAPRDDRILTVRQPWLPAQTITLRSGEKFIGYTLSDGTWIEVLKDDTRTIYYYTESDIVGRQICQVGHAPPMQPLITLTPAGTNVGVRTPTCQITAAKPSRPAPPSSPPIPIRGLRP